MIPYAVAPAVLVSIVTGDAVANDWPLYRPFVDDALMHEQEELDAVEIFQRLRAASWICLAVHIDEHLAGLCIVEQVKGRTGFVLNVKMLAGHEMRVWLDQLIEEVIKIAALHECAAVRVKGRMGWLRALKQYGFEPVSQTMLLEL